MMRFTMPARVLLFALLILSVTGVSAGQVTATGKKSQAAAHMRAAQQYLQQQQPELAIPELQKVVALDPQNVDARGNLGVLLFFQDKYKDAAPQLRAALKLKPDLWKLQALLGLAEGRLGDADASRKDLAEAFPHLEEAKFKNEVGNALLNNYAANGDIEKAAAVASELLAAQPTDTTLLYTANRLYSDLADKTLLTLAMTAPDSAQMHVIMARELARQGQEAAAIVNYREALKANPKFPGLHLELAELLYNSTTATLQAEAEPELKAALAENPQDGKAELMLGQIAAKAGDTKTAYADDSRALELQPDDPDANTELAKVLLSMGQRARAQQLLERSIQMDPTNYVAHYRLSTIYRQQGKTEDAKQQLAQYQKYKDMKDKLQKIFHDMRIASGGSQTAEDADGAK